MLGSRILRLKSKMIYSRMTVKDIYTLQKGKKIADAFKITTSKRPFWALYYESMYKKYLENPASVGESWRSYFENKKANTINQSSIMTDHGNLDIDALAEKITAKIGSTSARGISNQQASDISNATNLIRAYQTIGHEKAKTDPLRLLETYGDTMQIGKQKKRNTKRLDYRFHGFTDDSLNKELFLDNYYQRGFVAMKKNWKLKDLIEALEKAYWGNIGVEFMHIQDIDECNWIRTKFEEGAWDEPSRKSKLQTFDRVCWSVLLGDFLQSKYNTQKRFGLEGWDSFIPGLKCIIDTLVDSNVEQVTIGMPHRGRLNVLANVLRKPLHKIFQEFTGESKKTLGEEWGKSGDVKYHLGTSYRRVYDDTGKAVVIHLLPNPSHLEAVDPVVCGYVRAHQHYTNDHERKRNVPILIHGDAAFAGQGIVYETIQMADLYNYTTGGTIHIIVNNQIGFTTTPIEARSGINPSDLAKAVSAPIFHVNADDVLAVEKCCKLAAEYRMRFKKDVVVDIIGYRRFGHNELDQPSFTQPLMYEQIRKRPNVLKIFEEQLISEGVFTEKEAKEEYKDRIWEYMMDKYNIAKQIEADKKGWVPSEWDTIKIPKNLTEFRNTGVDLTKLRSIGKQICTIPEDFDAHKMIRKIYEARFKSIEDGVGIDWGTAEALAFATLIDEDFHVRISGQDVERGTFSHRHAHLHSQSRDEEYIPLEKFYAGRIRKFIASNSHLSENAVLGFEYGYSIVNPNNLTIWEAQFGDFYNGAQAIVDQFISSGEAKWDVSSGLVMLLPHGYDGAGPEHSSGRVERFLEMWDDDPEVIPDFGEDYFNESAKHANYQVCNVSTSANYFHLLRRQMHRDFRKPLVLMAPKKLLKHKDAGCHIEDFGPGLRFKRIIKERDTQFIKDNNKVKKVILCTGQVYYDLVKERKTRGDHTSAIVTIEQLFPLPYDRIKDVLDMYPNLSKIVWCQEEPKNYGAYSFIRPRLESLLKKYTLSDKIEIKYSGRAPNSSPATGFHKVHDHEQATLIKGAFE